MICNSENNQVLVQNKLGKSWGGITFPGGHIENGESITDSVIREVWEETGLLIRNLKHCGIVDYYNTEKIERWICFLYKTNDYSGTMLEETEEGKIFWTELSELKNMKVARNLDKFLEIFLREEALEAFAQCDNNQAEELKIII